MTSTTNGVGVGPRLSGFTDFMTMKPLILNADDYAMDPAVDEAILRLAERGVVTSTSVMTLAPGWPQAARRLADAPLDRGLHLDFTSPFVDRPAGLAQLMAAAYLGRLDRPSIRRAIVKQLDRYETALGAAPDFVDGHQHTHQLPGVREEVIGALADRYGAKAPQVRLRSCLTRRPRGVKAAVIAATGAGALTRLALAHGHPVNSDFLGVYDFSPKADLAALWRGWLSSLEKTPRADISFTSGASFPLAMSHVGVDGPAAPGHDTIRMARIREFGWFSSTEFGDLCQELRVVLIRSPQ
jgi:chitin disaccharide deacetylase